jgi:flap endonuclease-1
MGIKRLMNLLREKAPKSIKSVPLSNYTGQLFALDASMAMYQFLISTQTIKTGFSIAELRDEQGNLTGHLLGLLNRTLMLMEHGIRPVWVFDGKPPEAKMNTLRGRKEIKENAEKEKDEAKDQGDMEKALKFANQTIKIDQKMTDDAKKLISLLGIPVIEAPSEAEATCSILAKDKKVFAAATEDMDTLCFGCPVLIRELTGKEENIIEIKLDVALSELGLTMDEFVDLCILCGCDYCERIEGIGCIKAFQLIKEYKTIEKVIEYTEKYNKDDNHKKKMTYNKENFDFVQARELFKKPEVIDTSKVELNFTSPNIEGLKEFLVKEKNFSETRIDNAIKRLGNAKNKANQSRLDSFFSFVPKKDNGQTVNPGKIKAKQVSPDKAKNKKKKGSKKK